MIWMMDTDILIYLVNRKPGFESIARRMSGRSPGEVRLSAISLAELRFGVEHGQFRADNQKALASLLQFLQVDAFPVDAAVDFGEIKSTLLSKGKPLGAYDLLIAAHARQIGATVVTNNEREFRRVPGLEVENWTKA